MQIENLQEQLQAFAAQRDRAVMDLALSQEKVDQYQTSLNNLQLVLEQFQKGKIVKTVKCSHFDFNWLLVSVATQNARQKWKEPRKKHKKRSWRPGTKSESYNKEKTTSWWDNGSDSDQL